MSLPPSRLVDRINEEQLRERMNEVLAALRTRGALRDSHCPSCTTDNWNVDFLAIPSVPLPKEGLNIPLNVVVHVGISSSSSYIPAAVFVCTNCGYMKMYNLNVLLGPRGGQR